MQWIPQNLPEETDNQGEQDPQSSLIPVKSTITKSCIPLALKNLQSFNNSGLKE